MSRKNRSPEENARRAKIRELLQMANIDSMEAGAENRRGRFWCYAVVGLNEEKI